MSIKQLSDKYEDSTNYFLELLNKVSPELLDTKHPNGWSARQIIHHMADSEAQSYARLRRLVAEPEGSVIQGYDESAWANAPKLGYQDAPVENSIAVLKAVRASSLDLLRRLEESDLDRFGVHSEGGHYTLSKWLELYSNHPYEHGDQLSRALNGEE